MLIVLVVQFGLSAGGCLSNAAASGNVHSANRIPFSDSRRQNAEVAASSRIAPEVCPTFCWDIGFIGFNDSPPSEATQFIFKFYFHLGVVLKRSDKLPSLKIIRDHLVRFYDYKKAKEDSL